MLNTPVTHTVNAAETPIQSVTVYKNDKAQVVRVVDLEITAPENRVVVTNLPNSIDTSSIRVSGLGGAARLVDVSCNIPTVFNTSPSDAVHALTQRKKTLEAEKGIREEEAKILIAYGNSLCKDHASYAELTQFLEVFRAELAKGVEASREIEEQIRAVDAQISSEKESATKGLANAKITIGLVAESSCSLSLRLTYHVSNATWKPVYDLRASTTSTNSVSLHYRAAVVQSTGENWTKAQLTLSTADGQSQDIPRLGTYRIRFLHNTVTGRPVGGGTFFGAGPNGVPAYSALQAQQQQQQALQAQRPPAPVTSAFGQSAASGLFSGQSGGLFSTVPAPRAMSSQPFLQSVGVAPDSTVNGQPASVDDNSQPLSLSEGPMVVKRNSLSSSFTVQEPVTIPSDDADHTVHIASFTCKADITRICIPRLSANIFFQCRVKNVTQYKLLPGTINVFLDEEYVSKTVIKDIGPHDSFECALGVDPSLQVSYERVETRKFIETISFGTGPKDVTSCKAKTTVMSTNADTVKGLIIRDVLPIPGSSENDHLNVALRQPQGLLNVSADQNVDVMTHIVTSETDRTRLKELTRTVKWGKKDGKTGGRDEGKYEWVVDILPNEKISMVAEWDVKVPSGYRWNEAEEAKI